MWKRLKKSFRLLFDKRDSSPNKDESYPTWKYSSINETKIYYYLIYLFVPAKALHTVQARMRQSH